MFFVFKYTIILMNRTNIQFSISNINIDIVKFRGWVISIQAKLLSNNNFDHNDIYTSI